ncbi:hypothetical protein SISNIDRAFT_548293 [Sistotremastrum niveocremeum HHB9708]|uniref:Thioredoxin-like protein n=2 Tax=Sistotremastraceae TaxID=3402574 RepID=A0A164WTT6_9AGAM|nr:hypothetical protein SISNIDRAFT_548293 [Sistotremastrum niveocremeum HHB9708]KZT37164.1 hypothetical protein SISSUDRAFT_1129807 [Sistotremastrum suecicum HHB10207 ss-3]
MFLRFHKTLPNISIFHNSKSPVSQRAVEILKAAKAGPYKGKPLEFDLEIITDQPPTPTQFQTILSYTSKPLSSLLASAHPSASSEPTPLSEEALHEAVTKNKESLKWPVVVDWYNGRAVVGEAEGVKSVILEELRKERDGEKYTSPMDPVAVSWLIPALHYPHLLQSHLSSSK